MTTKPGEFAGFLSDLAKTASKDTRMPPWLTAIRLHTADGQLHGWSTDRYRAAHAVVSVAGELTEPVHLNVRDAEDAAKAFRKETVVHVSCEDGTLTLSGGGITLTYSLSAGGPKDLPHALRDELPTEHAPVRFQNSFLADFAAIAKRRKEFVDLVPNVGMRPTAVRIGEDYRAWLMPLQTAGRTDTAWLPNSWVPDGGAA